MLKAIQLIAVVLAALALYVSTVDLLAYGWGTRLPLADEISKSGISQPLTMLALAFVVIVLVVVKREALNKKS